MELEHELDASVSNPYLLAPPRLHWVMCASSSGAHRMAYWEWGDPSNDKVLLCVHGLTRNGRDFDAVAQRMAPYYRVIAPDVVGRGRSDWLIDPSAYTVTQYINDILVLLARIQAKQLDWIGTSMGGLIALGLRAVLLAAEQRRPQHAGELSRQAHIPLGKLVLNDVGPSLDVGGVQRIAEFVGQEQEFDSYQQALEHVQSVSQHLGFTEISQWNAWTRYQYIEYEGRWRRHYDTRLAQPFTQQAQLDLEQAQELLWAGYQHWPAAIMILRGTQSDILRAEQLQQMLKRHPAVQAHELAGIAHAPSLQRADELALLEQFLLERS